MILSYPETRLRYAAHSEKPLIRRSPTDTFSRKG